MAGTFRRHLGVELEQLLQALRIVVEPTAVIDALQNLAGAVMRRAQVVGHLLGVAPVTKRTKLALKLLLFTLQRSSEVIGMNRSELNLREKLWIIPAERTKNKKAHLVPLSPQAITIIKELLRTASEDGFLFPGEGKGDHLTNAALSRAIKRNLDHFGLSAFTPHDLRRTGSTQLAAFKVPRFDRDRVLNHTDRSIGAVYDVHEYEEEKRAALDLWCDVVSHCVASRGRVNANTLKKKLKYRAYFRA